VIREFERKKGALTAARFARRTHVEFVPECVSTYRKALSIHFATQNFARAASITTMATLLQQVPALPVAVGSMGQSTMVFSDPMEDARKRPLDVPSSSPSLLQQPQVSPLIVPPVTSSSSVGPLYKKAKHQHQTVVSSDDESGSSISSSSSNAITKKKKKKKKPQMKYDPDVPMTKEEATAWRRDQRRKRNRESAAASRQKQRDRIAELEEEVEQYKKAFEAVQAQIKALEKPQQDPNEIRSETPETVPSVLAQPASPTTCTFLDLNTGDGVLDKPVLSEEEQQQPIKMISRHA